MNEHTWIKQLHKQLPKDILTWKINDNFQGGVPDAYYLGPVGDIWVEYKYISRLPKRPNSVINEYPSPLQQKWLNELQAFGKAAFVIMASVHECVILEDINGQKITRHDWDRHQIHKKYVVDLIMHHTLVEAATHEEINKAIFRGSGKRPTL